MWYRSWSAFTSPPGSCSTSSSGCCLCSSLCFSVSRKYWRSSSAIPISFRSHSTSSSDSASRSSLHTVLHLLLWMPGSLLLSRRGHPELSNMKKKKCRATPDRSCAWLGRLKAIQLSKHGGSKKGVREARTMGNETAVPGLPVGSLVPVRPSQCVMIMSPVLCINQVIIPTSSSPPS